MRKFLLILIGAILFVPAMVKASEICDSYANMLIALNMEEQEVLAVTPPEQVAAVKLSYDQKRARLQSEMTTLGCSTGGSNLPPPPDPNPGTTGTTGTTTG